MWATSASAFSLARYLAVIGLFALGLMAKPMLVTLPFVLLLLDYWPLGRLVAGTLRVPPASSRWGGSCTAAPAVTAQLSPQQLSATWSGRGRHTECACYYGKSCLCLRCRPLPVRQRFGRSAEPWRPSTYMPMATRIANAAVSYVAYLGQMFWPVNLAVIYPHPESNLPAWKVVAALGVLTLISAGVVALRRRCPWLIVGWLWYLGMLVPVIGLVQVGLQSMADRYTYLPQIGLYVAIAWGIADVSRSWHWRGWACGVASAAVLAVLMGCSHHQVSFWRDSETLFVHALDCTSDNVVAHCNLGLALLERGETDQAIEHYREALRIDPNSVLAHNDLGEALQRLGRDDQAIEQFEAVLRLDPDHAGAHYNLGESLRRQGRLAEAVDEFEKSLRLDPDHADAHTNLGAALGQQGKTAEAIDQFT